MAALGVMVMGGGRPAPTALRTRLPRALHQQQHHHHQLQHQQQPQQQQQRRRRAPAVVAAAGPAVALVLPDGERLALPSKSLTIGSSSSSSESSADLQLSGPGVAPEHVRLELRGGRLFAQALTGDPELLLSPTAVWLDGVELRAGVSDMVRECWGVGCIGTPRLAGTTLHAAAAALALTQPPPPTCTQTHTQVAPSAVLAVGSQEDSSCCLRFDFVEGGGSSAVAEMLVSGMAAGASAEVQEQLKSVQG